MRIENYWMEYLGRDGRWFINGSESTAGWAIHHAKAGARFSGCAARVINVHSKVIVWESY